MAIINSGRAIAGLLATGFATAAALYPARAQEIEKGAGAGTMSAPAASVSQDQLSNAVRDTNNFLHTNGNYDQTRYFPGKQIDTTNVGKLHPA